DFFFQAEDGIRDRNVTGVQTCALPISAGLALLTSMLKSLGHIIEEAANDRMAVRLMERNDIDLVLAGVDPADSEALELLTYVRRSEERRVGKEGRCGLSMQRHRNTVIK